MNIKSLISNLLDLSKSASFVFVAFLFFLNVNEANAYYSRSANTVVCEGLPTSSESGEGSSTGSGSGSSEGSSTGSGSSSTTGK